MKKKAFITGINGMDGSHLADLLLNKNYKVYGVKRRTSLIHTTRIDHIYKDFHLKTNLILKYGDVTDFSNVFNLINEIKPDEIYNLAAQSNVGVSFELAEYTAQVDSIGTLRILEAIRIIDKKRKMKFYQASTSEIFGNSPDKPYNEKSKFEPVSPYGTAKLYSYWTTRNYRDAYSMFASNGILFNHESPRRGETFVTKKITKGLSNIFLKKQKILYIGNLDSKRDWGHAKDYVEGMWLILQQNEPSDYVLATGVTTSVRDFVKKAFLVLGIEISFSGKNQNEIGKIIKCHGDVKLEVGKVVVKVNKKYYRPSEVDLLIGDPSRANIELGWKPKYTLDELVKEMVESDYNKLIKK